MHRKYHYPIFWGGLIIYLKVLFPKILSKGIILILSAVLLKRVHVFTLMQCHHFEGNYDPVL